MNKPLKIIIFDGSLKATTFINRLASGLSKNHEVYLFGFDAVTVNRLQGVHYLSLGTSQNKWKLFIKGLGYALKAVFQKPGLGPFVSFLKALIKRDAQAIKQANFETALQTIAPDILHLQWLSVLPYIATKNGTTFRERLQFKGKIILSQRGYQSNVRPFVNTQNFNFLKEIYPLIDGFHSVSQEVSATGNLIYNPKDKIDQVVYSGFDFDALKFSEVKTKNNSIHFLSIGRPHWIKGYTYALKACALFKEAGHHFTYTIVGPADTEELLYLIDAYQLNDVVRLIGKISQEEVYAQMAQADALLCTSIKEGLPNVVVEAMALGLPVIATDCGGIKELLGDDLGICIPTRDPEALAAAMITFSKKPIEKVNEQRVKARDKVMKQHNTEKMITDMEALYYKCLQS